MTLLKQGSVLIQTSGTTFLQNKKTANKVSARHFIHLLAAFLFICLAYRVYEGVSVETPIEMQSGVQFLDWEKAYINMYSGTIF